MHEHVLDGCRPVPLAHYLKALGVLRLVGEQADPDSRGFWKNDRFVLQTRLDRDALERFFLEEYRPTPVVAPWNGGSGFHPKDNHDSIRAIENSRAPRLSSYRCAIECARAVLRNLDITEKVGKEAKLQLLEACRGRLPDDAVEWLDAALVLTDEGPKYPPLLGTGGNDGRLDFTNNFMQRLRDVLDADSGVPTSLAGPRLRHALFSEPTTALVRAVIGQFLPGDAGGANAEPGFDAAPLVNPWDFVLMIEGALAFTVAAVRKLETAVPGVLSAPFTVRQAAVGYSSAAAEDESSARAELWVPLWHRSATAREVRTLLSEGRAQVGGRAARNGVDFARAVATLGVDRGIAEFQRYGFQVRNGLAYFAVPLRRMPVRFSQTALLLEQIDRWVEVFRLRATSDAAPAAAGRALRTLERAILELCERDDTPRVQAVLVALGEAERVLVRSWRWTQDAGLRPVPPLSPQWLLQANDETIELRLAAALASIRGAYGSGDRSSGSVGRSRIWRLRSNLEPVVTTVYDGRLRVRWAPEPGRDVVWGAGDLVGAMTAVLQRRLLIAVQSGMESYPDGGSISARLDDVSEFINGGVDERRLEALLWGCSLIDWAGSPPRLGQPPPFGAAPDAAYAVLKLCFAGRRLEDQLIPIVPDIVRLAARGHGSEAVRRALARLRACGFAPAIRTAGTTERVARRSAAALLFPLGSRAIADLMKRVLRPRDEERQGTLTASIEGDIA